VESYLEALVRMEQPSNTDTSVKTIEWNISYDLCARFWMKELLALLLVMRHSLKVAVLPAIKYEQ
jgi:hypothetical protein